jgi:hypothetical protein
MSEIYCEKCGNAAQAKDRFCRKCGSSLGTKTIIAESTQSAKPKQNQSSRSHPPASPEQQQAQQQAIGDGQHFPKPKNAQVKKLEEQPDDRYLVARNPDEFFVTVGVTTVKAPACCPRCSNPANVPTHILSYNYAYDTGTTIMYGVLGQVFRFLLIGSSANTLLEVVSCEHCHRTSNMFKGLEWTCRVLGIILTGALLWISGTSPGPALINRGARGLVSFCCL